MAYIPPHLRKQSTGGETKPELAPAPVRLNPNIRLDEITHHFWPEEDEPTRDPTSGKTLHDSAHSPGQLAYVVLYVDVNLRWESDNIIFTKSSLNLLPQGPVKLQNDPIAEVEPSNKLDVANTSVRTDVEEGDVEAKTTTDKTGQPIAVFKQLANKYGNRTTELRFDGWYNIDKIEFLEPNSQELVRMLEQKWSRKNRVGETYVEERRGSEWNRSLGYLWAVVKLKVDEFAAREKGEPGIERLHDKIGRSPSKESTPKKSVNEMLAELRMGNRKGKVESAQTADLNEAVETKS